jgi:alpha-tubulin suppressor-like RCC1 family protein
MYRGLFRHLPLATLAIPAALMAGCTSESTTGPRIVSIAAVSGLGQSGLVGANLDQPFVVRAEDQSGASVAGALITWTVLTGGGTVTPAQSVTDANGQASATLRLGSSVGQQTVRATLEGAQPVIFSATASSAPASALVLAAGDNQTATVKTTLATQITVKATDAFNNPKTGVAVVFQVVLGGGLLSSSTAVTDESGLASVAWTLGSTAGTQRVSASATGVTPVTFNATALAAAPASLAIVTGSGQSAAPGARLPDSLIVRVIDAFNNPVKDVVVTWAALGDAGTVSPASSKTDAAGRAGTSWTLGATGGPKEVRATVQGLTPVEFKAAGTIIFASVMAGGRHVCGLDEGGVAYCWGFNGDGQLGIGETAAGSGPVFAVPQPTAVAGGVTFAALSGGGYHTCGTALSSNPYCWGKNVDGRLGNGGNEAMSLPTHVAGVTVFPIMAAGGTHTCALTSGGRLWCWGSNLEGQVGIVASGAILPDSVSFNKPAALLPAMSFKAVATGGLHSCAVDASGAAWCWGNNAKGQLGTGGGNATVPAAVTGSISFATITAGERHTCGLTAGGAAHCWGSNGDGQLGIASSDSTRSAPAAVAGGLSFVAITAGAYHTCGLTATGIGYCWGRNSDGRLGDGTTTSSNTPVAVGGGLTFAAISAGDNMTCGVTTGRVAYCWGNNQYGQLGDGTQTNRLVPMKVTFQP